METSSESYHIIRVKIHPREGIKWLWRYIVTKYNSETLTDRIEEATQFDQGSIEGLVRVYQACLKRYAESDVEYVKIEVIKKVEPIDLNQGVYLEERRRIALSKLSDDDVKALGVEALATYNKLKYHESKTLK